MSTYCILDRAAGEKAGQGGRPLSDNWLFKYDTAIYSQSSWEAVGTYVIFVDCPTCDIAAMRSLSHLCEMEKFWIRRRIVPDGARYCDAEFYPAIYLIRNKAMGFHSVPSSMPITNILMSSSRSQITCWFWLKNKSINNATLKFQGRCPLRISLCQAVDLKSPTADIGFDLKTEILIVPK